MAGSRNMGTRDRIVDFLRRREATVEELARALGISDNAVRSHLPAMERDGLVEAVGTRPTTRKPAVLYRTTMGAEERLSKAYVPLLKALLDSLEARLDPAELVGVLEDAGQRLASEGAARDSDPAAAAERARGILEALGAAVTVGEGNPPILEGAACPVGAVVRDHPEVCRAVQRLIAAATGRRILERCRRDERPACRFELGAPAGRAAGT